MKWWPIVAKSKDQNSTPTDTPIMPASLKESDFDECKESIQSVQFFFEQARAASALYWTRSNVFLGVQSIFLTGAFAWTTSTTPPKLWVFVVIGTLGIAFCFFWARANKASRNYHDILIKDARRLLEANPKLKLLFWYSIPPRREGPSASKSINCVIFLFAIAWLTYVLATFGFDLWPAK